MKLCMMFLTCLNHQEADKISTSLLEKKLVFCIKKFPVSSSFLWKGKIEHSKEILLIMDSLDENFDKVKNETAKLHSYDTFVLLSSSVLRTTKEVGKWVNQELQ